ncbi:hypothetical protein VP01_2043g2 [Puccinia sorghi]|uniref:Uncharacterized protein n=1 Tax=Puccinia sorghi TaxID=27349 RepID=A0A0L6VB25_9BASI|nr:hypothetical protein VP01_2043g2 [Puccinia sorghi]
MNTCTCNELLLQTKLIDEVLKLLFQLKEILCEIGLFISCYLAKVTIFLAGYIMLFETKKNRGIKYDQIHDHSINCFPKIHHLTTTKMHVKKIKIPKKWNFVNYLQKCLTRICAYFKYLKISVVGIYHLIIHFLHCVPKSHLPSNKINFHITFGNLYKAFNIGVKLCLISYVDRDGIRHEYIEEPPWRFLSLDNFWHFTYFWLHENKLKIISVGTFSNNTSCAFCWNFFFSYSSLNSLFPYLSSISILIITVVYILSSMIVIVLWALGCAMSVDNWFGLSLLSSRNFGRVSDENYFSESHSGGLKISVLCVPVVPQDLWNSLQDYSGQTGIVWILVEGSVGNKNQAMVHVAFDVGLVLDPGPEKKSYLYVDYCVLIGVCGECVVADLTDTSKIHTGKKLMVTTPILTTVATKSVKQLPMTPFYLFICLNVIQTTPKCARQKLKYGRLFAEFHQSVVDWDFFNGLLFFNDGGLIDIREALSWVSLKGALVVCGVFFFCLFLLFVECFIFFLVFLCLDDGERGLEWLGWGKWALLGNFSGECGEWLVASFFFGSWKAQDWLRNSCNARWGEDDPPCFFPQCQLEFSTKFHFWGF